MNGNKFWFERKVCFLLRIWRKTLEIFVTRVYLQAEECFKECVSIDQRHLRGLLLYGVVCSMQDKHETAETFFEAATSLEPESILAWTMLGS